MTAVPISESPSLMEEGGVGGREVGREDKSEGGGEAGREDMSVGDSSAIKEIPEDREVLPSEVTNVPAMSLRVLRSAKW